MAFQAEAGEQLTGIFHWNKDFIKYLKYDLGMREILETLGFSVFHFPRFIQGLCK